MILERSVGMMSDDNHPGMDSQVVCSTCFDRMAEQGKALSEFPALAGQEQTVYDLEDDESLGHASQLSGQQLVAEDFLEEFSLPIVCSECNETVGMVQCTRLEQ